MEGGGIFCVAHKQGVLRPAFLLADLARTLFRVLRPELVEKTIGEFFLTRTRKVVVVVFLAFLFKAFLFKGGVGGFFSYPSFTASAIRSGLLITFPSPSASLFTARVSSVVSCVISRRS